MGGIINIKQHFPHQVSEKPVSGPSQKLRLSIKKMHLNGLKF